MADEPNEGSTPNTPDPVFLVDEQTKQFFETYVGPGKKYPNVGELAKAYANADNHIGNLTQDVKQIKTEAESLKELLMENLVNTKPNDDQNPNPQPNDVDGQPKPADAAPPKEGNEPVDVKALIREALEEVNTEETRKKNSSATEAATVRHFGSQEEAIAAIAAKASELGVSPQWIANLAFDSPKAYYSAMGFDPDSPPKSRSTPAPSSDVNAQKLAETHPGVKPNTYKWFQELRKSDPQAFRSGKIQTAMMKAAAENPDFYS